MKKILIFLFCYFAILLGFGVTPTFADFAGLRSEYTQKLSEYNSAYSDYTVAKSTHATYQTLASLTQALDKSKIYLQKRDELIILHFQMLDAKIDETEFVSLVGKDSLKKLADDEITFFQNHLTVIPAIATLKDVTDAAKQAEAEIPLSNVKSKQILGKILIAKVESLKTDYEKLSSQVENQILSLKSNHDKLNRWLVEVKNKDTLCENNLLDTNQKLNSLQKQNIDVEKNFNEARIAIIQSNLYLKEGTNYMKEILNEIKYQ